VIVKGQRHHSLIDDGSFTTYFPMMCQFLIPAWVFFNEKVL